MATTGLAQLTGDYDLDPAHTRIGFSARHAMVATVRGHFSAWSGSVHLDGEDLTKTQIEINIDALSIDTGNDQRDGHLKSPDFLDANNYPSILFRSTGVDAVGDETFTLRGDLTIKDVTRPIEVEFTYNGSATDPYGNQRVGFEGRATINRKDWGLTWNVALETGGILVGDKVKLELDVEAVRKV